MSMATLAERVRDKIKDEMARKHLSQRDVAGLLGWSQSRIAKLMTGRVELGIDDLEGLSFAVGLAPTEVVRDRGLEFCAEMTPTELRLLERYRQSPNAVKDALLTLMDVKVRTAQPERHAGALKRKSTTR